MNNQIAIRRMVIRHPDDESSPPHQVWIAIGPVELFEPETISKRFRCVVTTGPTPLMSNPVYGTDQVTTLIAALGAVESFCKMLNVLGELTLDSGLRYDPDVDSVRSLSKFLWEPGFRPPFLSQDKPKDLG